MSWFRGIARTACPAVKVSIMNHEQLELMYKALLGEAGYKSILFGFILKIPGSRFLGNHGVGTKYDLERKGS